MSTPGSSKVPGTTPQHILCGTINYLQSEWKADSESVDLRTSFPNRKFSSLDLPPITGKNGLDDLVEVFPQFQINFLNDTYCWSLPTFWYTHYNTWRQQDLKRAVLDRKKIFSHQQEAKHYIKRLLFIHLLSSIIPLTKSIQIINFEYSIPFIYKAFSIK